MTVSNSAGSRRTRARSGGRVTSSELPVVRWLRVGAVAAGIGSAVVTGHGVAVADDTDTGTESSAASSTDASDSDTSDAEKDSLTDPGSDEESGEPQEQDEPEEPEQLDEPEDLDETGSDETGSDETDPVVEIEPEVLEPEVLEPEVVLDTEEFARAGEHRGGFDLQTSSSPTAYSPSALRSSAVVEQAAPPVAATRADAVTTAISVAAVPALPPQATVSVTPESPAPVSAWLPARNVVIGVLDIFGFDPEPAPGDPPNSPVLEAIWGLYRRIESVFANERPTVVGATVTDSQIVGGVVEVTGEVEFDDYNDDTLSYTATNGAHGTVTVGEDGTFVYTPTDPSFTGTDSFEITASDESLHAHGLRALLQPANLHTTTTTVTITLTEAPNQAPVISNHSGPSEPDENGAVTGTFTVTDLNGDPIEITADGTVDIVITHDPSTPTVHTVTYTYTPSFDTRLAASYAGTGSETLTFTASDGELVSDALTVAVDVEPFDPHTVIATIGDTPGSRKIVLSADGSTAYVGGTSTTVQVIDTATFTVIDTVDVGAPVNGLVLAENDTRLYATHADAGTISVVDTTTNAVLATIDVEGTPLNLAVSPDGSTIYVPYGGGVRVIDASDRTIVDDIPITTSSAFFRNIAVSPDGETLYVTGGDGITVIDTETAAVTRTIVPDGYLPSDIVVSPDGETLYITTGFFGSVRGIDVESGNVVGVRYYSGLELGLSPDGSTVYATDFTGDGVYAISTTDYEIIESITVGNRPQGVVFSPDGALAYVTSAGTGTVSVIWTGLA